MDDNKGLKILSETLEWDDSQARDEFRWLKMMAAIKYDEYRDYLPGMRFMEYLAGWLQQFAQIEERREAYALLRKRLIFVSSPEMQRLVELLYPCFIERRLVDIVARKRGIPNYMVHVDRDAQEELKRTRRRTLILGMSDGARIDILRHSTVGILNNEQFVIQTQVDQYKWQSLLDDLRESQGNDPNVFFEVVFLVDDFIGTGTSYFRYNEKKKKWTGKLCRFLDSLSIAHQNGIDVVSKDWQLCVHHYLATQQAAESIPLLEGQAMRGDAERPKIELQRPSVYSFGALISTESCVSASRISDANLIALTNKYYSTKIQTKHTDVGGVSHIGLGYGGCALPLILHHNSPNNSLAILWAELESGPDRTGVLQPEMRPLFRRRQRHTG